MPTINELAELKKKLDNKVPGSRSWAFAIHDAVMALLADALREAERGR